MMVFSIILIYNFLGQKSKMSYYKSKQARLLARVELTREAGVQKTRQPVLSKQRAGVAKAWCWCSSII